MKAFKYILFLLLIMIIGTSIYIAVQPNEYTFSRSRIITAPTPVVFNEVNDYKNWIDFSPWLEQEPKATLTYLEKTIGIDAGYAWNGDILGEGNMTTLAVAENKSISQKLNFVTPFESESNIEWNFEPENKGTKVTWSMSGKQDFMAKMYTAFSGPFEKSVGPDFERGLFKLDSVVNANMQKYSIKTNGITTHGGGYYLYIAASCKINELSSKMQEMLPRIKAYADKNKIKIAGTPFINYYKWDEENNTVMFSCCIPTTEKIISNESDILTGHLPPFNAVKTTLQGNYKYLEKAWAKATAYIPENGLENLEQGPMLEVYETDPSKTPNPADWITEIYIAIKPFDD
ncbi:SRPBCC family protein [Algibacter sp. L1A34]|uniref:SRPBCC family protein n=1 Tax=Algibacter sp. L1A34 TaxID=2686365 RepID=UPI00131ACABD|nr:GyrI-like domain-containing protein [Algibacter sp. L1A34]